VLDHVAFADLVEAHQSAVFGTALRLLRHRDLAADVTNRAFYKAYTNLASYDSSRPIRPWLVQIAANEALNELRRQGREAAHTFGGAEAELALERVESGSEPAESIAGDEQRAAIRAAVAALPEQQRVVVVLRYFSDLSYAEIADITHQSQTNVGVILTRARERLRRDLEARGVTSDALA
jgi:RNA polymerase sigma-70 factor (ECF subfamily)